MLRVGIIGAGAIAAHHTRTLKQFPDCVLTAVADLNLERAEKAAEPFSAAAYTDYMEMLDKAPLDAVIINLPHGLHEEASIACAKRNLHTLLEKPMSISSASCQRIIDAFKNTTAILHVGHPQSYSPTNRAARDIITSGELGELICIEDVRTASPYFSERRPKWFWTKKMGGGGISLNLGAHCFDKACFLSGSTIESCTGKCTYLWPESEVDASVQAHLQMKNGVTANITVSGYIAPGEEVCRVFLTNGHIRVHTREGVTVYRDGKTEPVDLSQYDESFVAQWKDFLKGIELGRTVGPTGEYAQEIVKNIESLWDYEPEN